MKRTAACIAIALLGICAGSALTVTFTAHVHAQPNRRLTIEHYDGAMFIRQTNVDRCFIAVDGGGIVEVPCGPR